MNASVDPVRLTQDLIRIPSITPADEGAMDLVQAQLERLGFACRRMAFEGIENLYARRGSEGPNLCFAGHTDVVPPGPLDAWRHPPFAAEIEDGVLYGRGAADMKGCIAAWIAALDDVLAEGAVRGSLSLLITGDEEGRAIHGTRAVVEVLRDEGEVIDACVVGEPSSVLALGDTIKIGRRGSLNAWITVEGRQGHVAYPERGANPIPVLLDLLEVLRAHRLDDGFPEFPPSNLEITTLDVGNPATNVIPEKATARLNIRFNPNHSGESLTRWLRESADHIAGLRALPVRVETLWSGDAFLTEPGPFVTLVQDTVEAVTGTRPVASTSGGTSDARFIRALCPVVELGLVGQTIHQIDERVPTGEILALRDVYAALIRRFFEQKL
jgi:succinyl-diaminopimelate desuccinylase